MTGAIVQVGGICSEQGARTNLQQAPSRGRQTEGVRTSCRAGTLDHCIVDTSGISQSVDRSNMHERWECMWTCPEPGEALRYAEAVSC